MKILIADDSAMLRDMLVYALNNGGYNDVEEAVDGADALNKVKRGQFDLIITDVNMPNIDGISLIKEIRKLDNYKTIPILVLTTERTEDMKKAGREAGATGWVVKPFVPDQLLKVVNIVLKSTSK